MKQKILQTILFPLLFLFSITVLANNTKIPPRPTKKINAFIQHMVKKYNFNRKELTALMQHAKYNPKVIRSITYPFEKKPWNFYRRFFLTKERIEGGAKYWEQHLKTLNAVKKEYGVNPAVIIAIIAIESKFGKHAGTYNELSALSTLAFYYPKRSKFFKKELIHFLLLTRKEKLPTLEIRGSYAGALGIPQFMPSSYRHYAVDYTKNQSIDLMKNHDDAIASIANYLKRSGWKLNQPVAVPAKISGKVPQQLISKKAIPNYTIKQLEQHKVFPAETESANRKAALIAMQNTDSSEYWIVFRNFRAIMKYNPRTTYSMAVYELSRAIKQAYDRQNKTSPTTSHQRTV